MLKKDIPPTSQDEKFIYNHQEINGDYITICTIEKKTKIRSFVIVYKVSKDGYLTICND